MAENFESENNENDEDFDENRSVFRYFKNLKQIFEKYSDESQVSDVVDMETLEVITDNGDLADQKFARFGHSNLAITKKESAGRIDEREYEEFLRDPDSFISPANLPVDPLKVKTENPEAFNKTYVVNTLKQHSEQLHKDVKEDALCKLEETLVEIIDSTSSDESSDYPSDDSVTSSSSSSGDDLFLYRDKNPSGKSGDLRNNSSYRRTVQSGKSPGHWNVLLRSPWRAKDKAASPNQSQKSPGIFKNKKSSSARSRNENKLSRVPANHRQCGKALMGFTSNIPDRFEFESNHFEADDEKENLLGTEDRAGQQANRVTDSSHRNPFNAPERGSVNLKHPSVPAAVNAVKRRITPSLVRPLSDHHTPPKVGPISRTGFVGNNAESPSVSMTKSLNCLTLANNIDQPLDLSKNTSSWNSQNPHIADAVKVFQPKKLTEQFTGCYMASRTEESVTLLTEGSSEEMEDLSNYSSSDDEGSSFTKSPLPLVPRKTPNVDVKKSVHDHPFVKPLTTEILAPERPPLAKLDMPSDRPPMAKLAKTVTPVARAVERGAPQPGVKGVVGASPRGRPHVQPRTPQRSPFTSPVAFFKVMQRKNKESPAPCQKQLKPSPAAPKMLYSSSDDTRDAKQSVVRNDILEPAKHSKADVQWSPGTYQKKHKSALKMYSSGDSSSEAKQSLGRNDLQQTSAVYQQNTVAQKMMCSSGDSGSDAKQATGRKDYRESPKQSLQRLPAGRGQIKVKPGRAAERMLCSSGDTSSDTMPPLYRRDHRASTKQSAARSQPQHSPAGQMKPKPRRVAKQMLYTSEDSSNEARSDYLKSPMHSVVTDLPESTPNQCLSTREEVTPPHAEHKGVQAATAATTSTPTKEHRPQLMALDISCIPTNVTTLTQGPITHRAVPHGDSAQRSEHTPVFDTCEKVPENLCSDRQVDVTVNADRDDDRLRDTEIEVPSYRRVEPMEDSSTSKLGTDDTMEHDLRSTSDSDSADETFTVLSPQPKMFPVHRSSSFFYPRVSWEKKTPTPTPQQTYVSPLQKQVREKAAQWEHQKMAARARGASPAGSKQRVVTPKRRTHDSDSDQACSNTASRNTPKSDRLVNDQLYDSQNPAKHALSEPRRFFPNKKLTPSPRRFKEKSKSAVKNPRASKQLYSTTSTKVATPSPSTQKNLSQKSHSSWNWSFNKKQMDPYAKQLDVYELDTESCDSDVDAPMNQHHKGLHQKSKTGSKPSAVRSPRAVDRKGSHTKPKVSSRKNVSRIADSSSDEESDDTRPLLNSRSDSGMTNSSLCLGPGKCDKTFCFTCL